MTQTTRPLHIAPKLARTLAIGLLLGFFALASGCVYRMDIQQGNLLEEESINQVEVGMTRSQVQFLLGTPMITDAFRLDRWDYPYWFRQGRQRRVEQRWLVVFFDGDRVVQLEGRIEGSNARS
jgi:outer membrane protein assembly factor BamE